MKYFISIFLFVILFACTSKKDKSLFELLPNTGIDFNNKVIDGELDNSFYFRNFYNGGGVSIGDINNDSLPDIYFTSNMGENKLYLNRGDFHFEDISNSAGLHQDSMWSTGATMVDINSDGWLDIYECNSGHMKSGRRKNKLYINQRNNTFQEQSSRYGLDISGYCTQASFFDYDLDGDLDMFLINNSPMPFSAIDYGSMRDIAISNWKVSDSLKGGGNHLYQNDNGKFKEVTEKAGLHTGLISFGLGVNVSDINNDGYPDIYVGNDFIERDYLYINQGDGTFKDDLEGHVQHISMSSMSTDIADINNDGHSEIFTSDMIPDDDIRLKTTGTFDNIDLYLTKQKAGLYHQYVRNCLQLNNGDGSFTDIANYTNTYGTDWSWGALFFDADNDGLNDIFVCNGILKDVGDLDFLDFFSNDVYTKMMSTGQRADLDILLKQIPSTPLPNRFFKNNGNLSFTDVGKTWGLGTLSFSNGASYGDLDRDGDLDLVVNNENQPAFVYRNNSRELTGNHFIGFKLKGPSGNTFAIGSKISVHKGSEVFFRELIPVRGFQSSVDYHLLIGLGGTSAVDSVLVTWPDGTRTKLDHPLVDQTHYLDYALAGRTPFKEKATKAPVLFQALVAPVFDAHHEDEFIDFYYERNLPQMLSSQGPHAAIGDVNGDALQDVYIGGAKDQAGQLYLQAPSGGFVKSRQDIFNQYKDFEDVAVLFFDADQDRDLDLFIGAGGNATRPGERTLEHRLYINDGKGNFKINASAFPTNASNISVAAAYDYDSDGDEDLFVGGRSTPFAYGTTPSSYLYQNDGRGNFTDVTTRIGPQLSTIGMVTAALWQDVTGDGKKELVVSGEWMTTRIFSFTARGSIELKNTGLEQLYGWWQSLASADVNGDGRQDLLIGNIGENFYLRPSAGEPVKLWVYDFDQSGSEDQFLTRTVQGRDVPVFLKREVTEQFPFLKKDNLKHSDYAQKSVQQLFGQKAIERARQLLFNYSASVVALNQGGGHFRVEKLPVLTQLSSVNAICPLDVNGDNSIDLIVGGNLFGFPPQFGRLDGNYGQVLMGNGKGGFTPMDQKATGLNLKGEVKDILPLHTKNKTQLLITQNNLQPLRLEMH